MPSTDNTIISAPGQFITDAAGNSWGIRNGQVTVGGQVDPTTANVVAMAYEGGTIWQENAQGLWYGKTSPSDQWSPTYGTSTSPIPKQAASADDTVLIAKPTATIQDTTGNRWSIAGGQVVINGTPDPTTARVVALVYSNGQVWQENADGLWWGKSTSTDGWNPPYGTSQAPVPDPNQPFNQVRLTSTDSPIVDASGNLWAIQNGQVTVNGVADQSTRNVSELAYVNGQVWQENADGLWWSKSSPTDGWNPPSGTSQSPVPTSAALSHLWIGQTGAFENAAGWSPVGVPQAGDTATVTDGTVMVNGGDATGVNFALGEAAAHVQFNDGTFNVGQISGTGGTIDAARDGESPVTLTINGISLGSGAAFTVTEWQNLAHVVLTGDSNLAQGSSLDIGQLAVNHSPYAALENDGTMTLNSATFNVGNLSGTGTVVLTNNATAEVIGNSNTIDLQSGHLEIGYDGYPDSSALSFKAPITDFGSGSTITLDRTQATSEVVKQISATSEEMMLYNGSTLVADLTISGQSKLYATYTTDPAGIWTGSTTISAQNAGHAIPIITNSSANDTVIGVTNGNSGVPLIDANGNSWAIANGQVTVNGAVDPTTANVVELAYVDGHIWQENTSNLWWSKGSPADSWDPTYGTPTNPLSNSTFTIGNNGTAPATNIDVGDLTQAVLVVPGQTKTITTTGVHVDGTTLNFTSVEDATSLVINGTSSINNGSFATLATGGKPPSGAEIQNNGTMALNNGSVKADTLSGTGSVVATNGSTITLNDADFSNTVQLQDSQLVFAYPQRPYFLVDASPVKMDGQSSVLLQNVGATYADYDASSGDMRLWGTIAGSIKEVADLKLPGAAHVYAQETSSDGKTPLPGPSLYASTLLTTSDSGHSLPPLPQT